MEIVNSVEELVLGQRQSCRESEDSERDGFIHRLRLNMDGVRNAIRVDERDAAAFDSHAQDYTQYSPFVRSMEPRLGLYRNLCGCLEVLRFWYFPL
jgi:hypothetical protein